MSVATRRLERQPRYLMWLEYSIAYGDVGKASSKHTRIVDASIPGNASQVSAPQPPLREDDAQQVVPESQSQM
jgi:hypothetical protein